MIKIEQIIIDGKGLTVEKLENIASGVVRIDLSEEAWRAVKKARTVI